MKEKLSCNKNGNYVITHDKEAHKDKQNNAQNTERK
jgi:hypothetical protein